MSVTERISINSSFKIFLIVQLLIAGEVSGQFVLDRCDIETSWQSSNTLSLDTEEVQEGRSALTASGENELWFLKSFSQTDVGLDMQGYLIFSLYVANASHMQTGGHIEINSSGTEGNDALRWAISSTLQTGWNEVQLSLVSASVLGQPELDKLRSFVLRQPVSSQTTLKIDFIHFREHLGVTEPKTLDVTEIDFSTLDGKVMFGYQGWFSSKGDGGPLGDRYHHWGNLASGSGSPNDLSVEMWFDDRELDPDELYETGYYYPDGRQARSFSSYNKKTVVRHMKWLRDYGLDGVFLQRFMSEARDPKFGEFRDSVAIHIKDGSERYGRAFAMMWDGINYSNAADDVINDWKHLVDNLKLTESPNYLHHRGKPLISIWGYTVRDEAKQEELEKLIEFFHNAPEERYRASIKLGCNHEWRTQEGGKWVESFKKVEVISPWTVGRYGSSRSSYEDFADRITVPDIAWCNEQNIDYLPVNWPGFSWYNLHDGPKNQHARRGGNFFWDQVSGNMSRGAKSLYIAMFDEIDEATSFFKMPENAEQSPDKGYWLDLSADGYDLPSDWYLRCVRLATDVVKGLTNNPLYLETPPEGLDVFGKKAIHSTCGEPNGQLLLSYPDEGSFQFSIDAGQSYLYASSGGDTAIQISELEPGLYNVWVRHADGTNPTDMGDILIINSEPEIKVVPNRASCEADGSLEVEIGANPYLGAVQISLDGGQSFDYTVPDGQYRLTISGLALGSYQVTAKWMDTECVTNVGDVEIVTNVTEPSIGIEVFDEPFEGEICLGSQVALTASTSNDVVSWQWTGPDSYEAEGEYVVISDSLMANQGGEYQVTYVDTNGCSAQSSVIVKASESSVPNGSVLVEADGNLLHPNENVFCEGQRLILEAHPENTSYSYLWSGPNGFRKSGRRTTLTADAEERLSGTYFLKIEDGACYMTISEEIIISSASTCEGTILMENHAIPELTLYPNPSLEHLMIRSLNGISSVQILELSGKMIEMREIAQSGKTIHLRVSDLPAGVYVLRVTNVNGDVHIRQFVKE
ncbi:T9SS type A sorting domain-containing protein [Marinoscillum sp.]|uniref:T9SS type A sorting domain-containing protein n=1 Tax=Marinoscillum sp. TaxID=2024838 RepID=UPI003BA8673A